MRSAPVASTLLFIIALTLITTGCGNTVWRDTFDRSPTASGWSPEDFQQGREKPSPSHFAWVISDPPTKGYLMGRNAGWQSPRFPVSPRTFYRVKLRYRASSKAMVGMKFLDAHADQLQADHYCGLNQMGKWGRDQRFIMAKRGATQARLVLRPSPKKTTRVDSVEVSRASPRKVLAWMDQIYSSIPPVDYSPPEERWDYMQNTISRLKHGKSITIVLLGDSIMNDTANSHFQLLLERNWKADVTTVSSVKGGKGCHYYQQNGRIDKYVTSHDPDLLIIGGISHQFESDPIKRVVKLVRERSNPDILVMSSAAGRPHPDRQKFAEQLRELAENMQVGYLNMRGAWDAYIEQSGKALDWFLRDSVHANARGKQVMGRILARYLSP